MFSTHSMLSAPISTIDFSFNNPAWSKFDIQQQTVTNSIQTSNASAAPVVTEETLNNAEKKGKEVLGIIDGRTKDDKYASVVTDLNNQNKDTIIRFLDGFYSGSKKEGIIEFLDDEHDNGGKKKDGLITKDSKLNVIKSLIDYACQKGYHQNPNIAPALTALNSYYEAYTVGKYKDCYSFNNKTKKSDIDCSAVPEASKKKKDDKAIDALIKHIHSEIKKLGNASSLNTIG